METLLSVSFDNISSRNIPKIRKGLRQVEGLLAQICLSPSWGTPSTASSRVNPSTLSSSSPSKRHGSSVSVSVSSPIDSTLGDPATPLISPTSLEDLIHDPAFLEFYKIQQSFEWNVPSRLIETLTYLLGLRSSSASAPPSPSISAQLNETIISILNILHGLLLLHPPSRSLFSRTNNISLLLSLLHIDEVSRIITTTLILLTTALLNRPDNVRTFEGEDGLGAVCNLLRTDYSSTTPPQDSVRQVRRSAADFLSFYLLPETTRPRTTSSSHWRYSTPRTSWRSHPSNSASVSVSASASATTSTSTSTSDSRSGSSSKSALSTPTTPFSSPRDTSIYSRTETSSSLSSHTRSGSSTSSSYSSSSSRDMMTRSTTDKLMLLKTYLDDIQIMDVLGVDVVDLLSLTELRTESRTESMIDSRTESKVESRTESMIDSRTESKVESKIESEPVVNMTMDIAMTTGTQVEIIM